MNVAGENSRISPGQFVWMAVSVTVAGGVYLWPHGVITQAGTDAPYSTVIAWTFALVLARLAVSRHTKPDGGGVLHGIAVTLLIIEFWVALGISALLFALMLQAFYLPKTPVMATSSIIIGISVWMATRPIEGLARMVQFWFPLIIASVFVLAAALFFQAPWLRSAMPSPHMALLPIGECALSCWYLWMSGNCYPYLAQFLRDPRQAPKLTTIALGLQGTMVILMYVLVVSNMGPYATAILRWPLVYVANTVTVHTFIVSSLGMVTVMAWTTALMIYMAVHLWCMGTQFQLCFKRSALVHTGAVMGMGGLIILAVWVLPWTQWNLGAILVQWLGPIDLLRIGIVALPIALVHGWTHRGHRKKAHV